MDVTNNPPGSATVPCIPMGTRLWLFVVTPNAVGDRAHPPHNHCPSHQFFFPRYIMLLLFDVVGRRQRSPSYLPHSKQKFTDFCFTLDHYLSRFPTTDSTVTQKTRPSSCSFVYLFGVLGGHCTHDGRTISVTRPTTSLVF